MKLKLHRHSLERRERPTNTSTAKGEPDSSLVVGRTSKGKIDVVKRKLSLDTSRPAKVVVTAAREDKRMDSHIDLPRIQPVKGFKNRSTSDLPNDHTLLSKGHKDDLSTNNNLSRGSFQNSSSALTRVHSNAESSHGFFNIPVAIDAHPEKQGFLKPRSLNTRDRFAHHIHSHRHFLSSDNLVESGVTDTDTDVKDRSRSHNTIFGTILSLAHNAAEHVSDIRGGGAAAAAATTNVNETTPEHTLQPITRTTESTDTTSNHSSPANDSNVINDTTVVYKPGPSRSSSFLKRLDNILSLSGDKLAESSSRTPGTTPFSQPPSSSNWALQNSASSPKSTSPNSKLDLLSIPEVMMMTMTDLDRLELQKLHQESPYKDINIDDQDQVSSSDPLAQLRKAGQHVMHGVDNVKFHPLRKVENPIDTMGKGNLTLDVFDTGLPLSPDSPVTGLTPAIVRPKVVDTGESATNTDTDTTSVGGSNRREGQSLEDQGLSVAGGSSGNSSSSINGNTTNAKRFNSNTVGDLSQFRPLHSDISSFKNSSETSVSSAENVAVRSAVVEGKANRRKSKQDKKRNNNNSSSGKKYRSKSVLVSNSRPNSFDISRVERNGKRFSSLSTDEPHSIEPLAANKVARDSSTSRRSFSPILNKRVLPPFPFKNSMSRNRSHTDLPDTLQSPATASSTTHKVTSGTTVLTSSNPVMDIEYDQPFELRDIEYASEKKNAEFHNLFRDSKLNANERLIADYSCALSRDILLQGRMYISNQHVCFYSNILGWVNSIAIPFREIIQIGKKATAGIFPNGIVIDTLHTKYVFASFLTRDATFNLITDVWNQMILGKMQQAGSDDSDTGSQSGYSSVSDDNEEDREEEGEDGDGDLSSINDTDITSDELENDEFPTKTISRGLKTRSTKRNSSLVQNLGPLRHAPTTSGYKPKSNEKLISETVLDAPLGKVAYVLYGDDTSILKGILAKLKNFDFSPIPKLIEPKYREFVYYKSLNLPVGPNKTKCEITEKVINYDLDSYVQVLQTTKNPDVPTGNSFVVQTTTLLTWDKNNSTKVTVYISVEWTGKSWIKGTIEKSAFDGVSDSTKRQNAEIMEYIRENLSDTRSDLSRSRRKTRGETLLGTATDEENGVLNLPRVGPAKHAPTEPKYQQEKSDIIIENSLNFEAPLGTVFELLYGADDTYLRKILEKQNAFSISKIPAFSNNEREYTYTKKLDNSIGPKQTRCTITEKIEYNDINSYVCVKQIVRSHDVPYGNSFSVHTRTFLSWGPNNSTNMKVVINVVWTGKSLLKGTIERGSIDGVRSSTNALVGVVKEVISRASSAGRKVRRRSTKKVLSNLEKLEEEVKEHIVEPVEQENAYILAMISSYLSGFNLSSFKSIMSIILLILVSSFFVKFLVNLGNQPRFELMGTGRILIDGSEFHYFPVVKTLRQIYDDDKRNKGQNIGRQNKHGSKVSSNALLPSWVEGRHKVFQRPRKVSKDTFGGLTPGKSNEVKSKHKGLTKQESAELKKLMESIKITQQQLHLLQQKIDLMEPLTNLI